MPAPADCRTKEEVRAEIDRLDVELVALLAERFAYVRRMAELKREPGDAFDAGRVEAVVTRVVNEAKDRGLDAGLIEDMWRTLIDWNVAYERAAIGHGHSAMSAADFQSALAGSSPPSTFDPPLVGLWYAAKGNWEKAHDAVREEGTAEAAWVHAHLHRIEGDLDNAGYWYGQAGKMPSDLPLDEERAVIVQALLTRT